MSKSTSPHRGEHPEQMQCWVSTTGPATQLLQPSRKTDRLLKSHLEGLTSVVVWWLRIHTPNAGGPGSIPDQGTR